MRDLLDRLASIPDGAVLAIEQDGKLLSIK
jgi:hypothetical protein